ncbi:galactan 5-O-arabinofuranosyltransferase [Corynebacterium sp. J010B-136]|uniref:galactan 5-O-arabinofuranosyltransferase n=1 Tax=Corynebacterium sp. J010B-136 TaxID=2099401 RepID=UPI001E4B97BA|nr:galactan 5-O-arabinofuranosyltransferase [Corynebacterium sp. J010B-136]
MTVTHSAEANPPADSTPVRDTHSLTPATRDTTSFLGVLVGMAAAAIGGGLVTLIAWFVFKQVSLPAFNTSMVTRGLSTAGIVVTVVIVAGLLYLWTKRGVQSKGPLAWLTVVVAYLSPALIVICSLGMPLSASKLWLHGIQVDQVFRTQFLTRMTVEGGYADMNYADMPTFYPMGWFWLGGRMANLLGLQGWEAFQPWSLVSIAMACCLLVPVWQRLTGSLPLGTVIALTTTALTLTLAVDEPYSAVIALGVPAAAIMCSRAFHGSWGATAGLLVFLGISATFYTLFTGAIAVTVVSFVALVTAIVERSFKPIVRLAVIGFGSLAIAAIAWGPYLLAVLRADFPTETAAQHYLPAEGTEIPVPFLAPSIVGLLCLIGIVYLVIRVKNVHIRTLGWALIGVYLWIVASMVLPLLGTTLLGFRLEILVVLIMATAGVLGLAHLYEQYRTREYLAAVVAVITALAGIFYMQEIPAEHQTAIDNAYSDTDGNGERADKFPADSARYYSEIDEFFQDHNADVVMTDEKLFMAYYPYYGFNAFTAHYANPLGQFKQRNEEMSTWAENSWDQSPQEFVDTLENNPWDVPNAMIFRGDIESPDDGYKAHLAVDIFPNQPNVRYDAILFDPEVFNDSDLWDVRQIGPFVVAARVN